MKKRYIFLGAILVGTIIGVCGCKHNISRDLASVFMQEEYIDTFFGKGIQTEYINDIPVQKMEFTEWKNINNQYRMNIGVDVDEEFDEFYMGPYDTDESLKFEIEYVYNNNQVVIYYPHTKEYFVKPMLLSDFVNNTLAQGINVLTTNSSAKEYTMSLITELNEAYDITIEDDVKMNGIMTQHIVAISKEDQGATIRQEYWIDQRNWLVIKSLTQYGNYKIEFEYTDYKINPKIDGNLFDDTLQQNNHVTYLKDDLLRDNKEIKLQEVRYHFDAPIYYFKEIDDIKLLSVQYQRQMASAYGYILLTYKVNDEIEVMVQNEKKLSIYNSLDLGYEKIDISGHEANYIDGAGIKGVEIYDDNIRCTIYVKNSDISKEEFLELVREICIYED